MRWLSDRNSIRIIRFVPLILLAIVMVVAIPTAVIQSNLRLAELERTIRDTHLQQHKEQMRYQVNSAINQIEYEYALYRQQLRQRLRAKVDEACAIADSIYRAHPDASAEQLTERITAALRPIRFNDGRGYYFIFDQNGIALMHPLQPHTEGQPMLNRVDADGTQFLREHLDLIKKSKDGGAFHRWFFERPGRAGEHEKFGYGKIFEPLGWYIGTGEYVEDLEQEIHQRLLNWFTEHRFDSDGYAYVLNRNGIILAHKQRELIGFRADFVSDILRNHDLASINSHGKFIYYQMTSAEHLGQLHEKVGFIRRSSHWNWWIGAGFFKYQLDKKIAADLTIARQQHFQLIAQLSVLFVLVSLLALWPSTVLANSIQRRVSHYQTRIHEDLKQLSQHKDQLKHQAEHDDLTGLPNRLRIRQELEQQLAHAKRGKRRLALIYMDVDHFKRINSNYGHDVGDQLLVHLASLLKQQLADSGVAGRYGGDEFVISILNPGPQLPLLLQRFCLRAQQPIAINGHDIQSGLTAGVAIYPDDGENSDDLLAKADLLLQDAQKHHKGQALFFDEQLSAKFSEQRLLEQEVQWALQRQQIEVYYQPQVDSRSGQIEAVEALCRWHNPRVGMVPPDQFIAVAERTGDIHPLGDYVLEQACRQIHQLNQQRQQQQRPPLQLSVNISPMQLLQEQFVEQVAQILASSNLPPQQLTLELTENIVIEDIEAVRTILHRLKALQLQISLDDFGTGYSSLRYIHSLPIDEIKIDRAFVRDIQSNQHSLNVTKTIIAMAQYSQMQVVAEGVETVEQQHLLTRLGCQLLQGYLFAKPLPIGELTSLLQAEVAKG
ncbi:bifunctional diguanylate cyclase/phosphodiesterase [Ferrimonas senticii]|uniref:bifunctional diguanylate cyclase/phosphodiesterase n=1 Tax=Ferrimonas senticii TaxID=394566 RepID=UPI000421DE52|nr:EAL domain-containing protein [Ferrimonas senticii]